MNRRPRSPLSEDQIEEIFRRKQLGESIRAIASSLRVTYYSVWTALQEREAPRPALQESNSQSDSDFQSSISPVKAVPPIIIEEFQEAEPVDERYQKILRLAEMFEMDGSEILVLAGLVSYYGCKSIGEFVKAIVEPLMNWTLQMETRLNQRVDPEVLDRLWLDGAMAAAFIHKIQKNKKLWAYVEDFQN